MRNYARRRAASAPYLLIVAAIPKERYGVYVGVVNMMICAPMLLNSFTFGFSYKHFLNADPRMAITFAGVLVLLAAASMLRIRQTPQEQDVEDAAVV